MLLLSCNRKSGVYVQKEKLILEQMTSGSIGFKFISKKFPYTQCSDYGIPAHKESLWMTRKPLNAKTIFTKQELESKLFDLNTDTIHDYKKLRIPSQYELERQGLFKVTILTKEDLESLVSFDTIIKDIFLVKTYFGASSDVEF